MVVWRKGKQSKSIKSFIVSKQNMQSFVSEYVWYTPVVITKKLEKEV